MCEGLAARREADVRASARSCKISTVWIFDRRAFGAPRRQTVLLLRVLCLAGPVAMGCCGYWSSALAVFERGS
ncbi:hypothetical protein D3C79_883700 [compost metagenome]